MSTPHADTRLTATGIDPSAAGAYDTPLGITNPPIDELLDRASSKYALVIYSAKRARQITSRVQLSLCQWSSRCTAGQILPEFLGYRPQARLAGDLP